MLVAQGDWNDTVEKRTKENLSGTCGPYCSEESIERAVRLLEFAIFNALALTDTQDYHKLPSIKG